MRGGDRSNETTQHTKIGESVEQGEKGDAKATHLSDSKATTIASAREPYCRARISLHAVAMYDALTLVVVGAASAVGLYSCVLYDRSLRLQQQGLYLQTVVQLAQAYGTLSATHHAHRRRE